jgi:acyl carrier protein
MGMDVVELIMQVEESFVLDLPDDECDQVRTVGDLYRPVLKKLDVLYEPAQREPYPRRESPPWTAAKVWTNLKLIVVDQLQVKEDEVRESASFLEDLGAD